MICHNSIPAILNRGWEKRLLQVRTFWYSLSLGFTPTAETASARQDLFLFFHLIFGRNSAYDISTVNLCYYSRKTEILTLGSKDHYILILSCHKTPETFICEKRMAPLKHTITNINEIMFDARSGEIL